MNVLMVCAELAPLAKTGGLADAVTGLSTALTARGHDVRVLLPKYAHVSATGETLRNADERFAYVALAKQPRHPRVYLLDLPELAAGDIYTADERDASRFLKLADAAGLLGETLGWEPDVLHCHDWHAALVPAMQRARRPRAGAPTVLTLHNIGYQGIFAASALAANGYGDVAAAIDSLALRGTDVNFLRAGVAAADSITTVSPTYAREICTPAYGMGLEDLLTARRNALTGILNGVDYALWSPERDPFLREHFDARDLKPKYALKAALCERLGLAPDRNTPLIGIVSRLVTQKGIDLLLAALPTLLADTRARFAVLGSGDTDLATGLRTLAAAHPRRLSFTDGYDEMLAHGIIAGSDLLLVPSRYEPCGLTQMYALRYGTVPVVRATGGLADTIRHFDPATAEGNGSVFADADIGGVLWGTRAALAWYADPPAWSQIIANGMRADFSWSHQVGQYEAVYRTVT